MEAFKKLAFQYGGEFIPPENSVESRLIQHLRSSLRRVQKDGTQIDVQIGLVSRVQFGARASRFGDKYAIGIDMGVTPILRGLFTFLISHHDFFPWLPTDPQQPPYSLDKSLKQLPTSADDWGAPELLDSRRAFIASELANLGFVYVLYHEFAHIWNGHVDWLARHNGQTTLDETPVVDGVSFAGVTRQTLEWDADLTALQNLMQAVLATSIDRSSRRWKTAAEHPLGSVKDRIMYVMTVALAVHAFFSTVEEVLNPKALNMIHPAPFTRQAYNWAQCVDILVTRIGMDVDQARSWTSNAVAGLGAGLQAILPGRDIPQFEMVLSADQRSAKLLHMFTDEWERLHPELLELQRGSTIAPPRPDHYSERVAEQFSRSKAPSPLPAMHLPAKRRPT